jgi:solute carrier family 25 carnitine/acylcarnitine transporter 20/29
MKNIIKNDGFKGLYKGNLITMAREMPAYAAQFATYELTKSFLTSKWGESQFLNLISGGIAGFSCWAFSYPQDVIKTKLQCDFGDSGKRRYANHQWMKDGGIISCAKDIYRHEGLRGFWRGFSACTIRAVIANSFTFVAYEEAKKLFI